jgi:integrase
VLQVTILVRVNSLPEIDRKPRGATLAEVKDALGHSSIATTSIYLHSDPEHLRAHMEI